MKKPLSLLPHTSRWNWQHTPIRHAKKGGGPSKTRQIQKRASTNPKSRGPKEKRKVGVVAKNNVDRGKALRLDKKKDGGQLSGRTPPPETALKSSRPVTTCPATTSRIGGPIGRGQVEEATGLGVASRHRPGERGCLGSWRKEDYEKKEMSPRMHASITEDKQRANNDLAVNVSMQPRT